MPDFENILLLLKSISSKRRFLIICSLISGEKSVTELQEFLKLEQSALSQHLARLRKDNIVQTRRQARTIFYSIKDPRIHKLFEFLCDVSSDKSLKKP